MASDKNRNHSGVVVDFPREAVLRIRRESDPQKIIELAMPHSVRWLAEPCEMDIHGYEEKLAAIKNANTPTLFLLYLYKYPKNKPDFHMKDTVIGPLHDPWAPFVNDEIREAARDEMARREWKLTQFEIDQLGKMRGWYMENVVLRNEKIHYEADTETPLNTDTPYGKMVKSLTSLLRR